MELLFRVLLVLSSAYSVLALLPKNSSANLEVQQILNGSFQNTLANKNEHAMTSHGFNHEYQAEFVPQWLTPEFKSAFRQYVECLFRMMFIIPFSCTFLVNTPSEVQQTMNEQTRTVDNETSTVEAITIPPPSVPENHGYLATICGTQKHKRNRRLIGGTDSAFGKYPWHVKIRTYTYGYTMKSRIVHSVCGGVIITRKHVLSVATCFLDDEHHILMTFGLFATSQEFGQRDKSRDKHAIEVFMHEDHQEYPVDHGLAVLKTKKSIDFTSYIRPICLPEANKSFFGKFGITTSWGMINTSHFPDRLQETAGEIQDRSNCPSPLISIVDGIQYTTKDTDSYFCIPTSNGTTSSGGDSGNPFMVERPDGRWELVGSVAYIHVRKDENRTEVINNIYLNISHHVPWINAVLLEEEDLESINTIVKRY